MQQPAHEPSATEQVAANLRSLKAYYDKTDDQIAREMGQKRSWVQERMSGARECKVEDVAHFADYFGVEPGVLFSRVPIILDMSNITAVVTTGQLELPIGHFNRTLELVKVGE